LHITFCLINVNYKYDSKLSTLKSKISSYMYSTVC